MIFFQIIPIVSIYPINLNIFQENPKNPIINLIENKLLNQALNHIFNKNNVLKKIKVK